MEIDYDPVKNTTNIEGRGLDFGLAEHFEWETALRWEDTRKDYGERRYCAMGMIGGRLHALVFTLREGDTLRVISLRKANDREVKRYEAHTQP